jgi:hypothetical protein
VCGKQRNVRPARSVLWQLGGFFWVVGLTLDECLFVASEFIKNRFLYSVKGFVLNA